MKDSFIAVGNMHADMCDGQVVPLPSAGSPSVVHSIASHVASHRWYPAGTTCSPSLAKEGT